MENSNIDINEIKDRLVKAVEDFSKEYTFKPSAEDNKNIVSVRLKDVLSKEVCDDILRRYTIPIQTFDIYVEPPKRESSSAKQ